MNSVASATYPVNGIASAICFPDWEKLICITETDDSSICSTTHREHKEIRRNLQDVFEGAPRPIQKLICELEQIKIVEIPPYDFFYAHADMYKKIITLSIDLFENSAFVHFIKKDALENIILSDFTEIVYDNSIKKLTDTKDLRVNILGNKNYRERAFLELTRVFMHELAHIFEAHSLGGDGFHCTSHMNWFHQPPKNSKELALTPLTSSDQCVLSFPRQDAADHFSKLQNSPFVSPYATCNMQEDFAEFFSWYILFKFYDLDFEISKKGEVLFRLSDFFASPKASEKSKTIDAFLKYKSEIPDKGYDMFFDHLTCSKEFSVN